ncbi:MAG: lysyl oxidase family protein, partial [Methylococcales bacterium]
FERTGYSCMNEHEYPPGSVFEENARFFYDDTCTAKSQKCHITAKPDLSCEDALLRDVGRVRTELNFTRVAYNAHIAAPYRVGTIRPDANDTADLAVIPAGLSDTRAFLYRFFAPGSCELEEGVIGRFGWRRLLTFSAIVRNDGGRGIDLGDVSDPDNPYVASHAFEYSACHQHYHFSHYGTFTYHDAVGTKRAFCLEETDRYHNNEKTPLTAKHQTCANQGIGAGWGDEYHFGIPGQWVDVTDIDTTTPHELGFLANPDQFLCEGLLEHDDQGQPLFEPTPFANTAGQIQTRARCRFLKDWNRNNFESLPVASQGGCFVTEDCRRGQLGPKRNCGFSEHPDYKMRSCTSGASVKLTCNAGSGKAALLRVCEVSKQLGVGVACTLADAKANVMVETTPTEVTFACPEVRDALMVDDDSGTLIPTAVPGTGGYSIYLAPMGTLSDQEMEKPTVLCTAG